MRNSLVIVARATDDGSSNGGDDGRNSTSIRSSRGPSRMHKHNPGKWYWLPSCILYAAALSLSLGRRSRSRLYGLPPIIRTRERSPRYSSFVRCCSDGTDIDDGNQKASALASQASLVGKVVCRSRELVLLLTSSFHLLDGSIGVKPYWLDLSSPCRVGT